MDVSMAVLILSLFSLLYCICIFPLLNRVCYFLISLSAERNLIYLLIPRTTHVHKHENKKDNGIIDYSSEFVSVCTDESGEGSI